MKFRTFLFVIIMVISLNALADTNGWTNSAVVTSFWCPNAKSCIVEGNFGNPGSCATANQIIIDQSTLWGATESDGTSNGGFNLVMGMVMTSQTGGKKFRCWIYGCQSAQGTSYGKCVQPGLNN